MAVSNQPDPATANVPTIFEVISSAKYVREHFGNWLNEFFKGKLGIEEFKNLHESIRIGIVYNYLTKNDININVYILSYDIWFIKHTDKQFEELYKMSTINIVERYQMDFYIEREKRYNGNIMQGLKLAVIDTINFLNNSKWLMN